MCVIAVEARAKSRPEFRGGCPDHVGSVPGPCDHVGSVLGACDHAGSMLGWCPVFFLGRGVSGLCWVGARSMLGPCLVHAGVCLFD